MRTSMATIRSGLSSPGPNLVWDPSEEVAHKVQFYHEDSFLLDQLDQFIAPVIASGNSVILIVDRAHRDGLYDRLRSRGTEFALAVGQERFLLLDAEETLEKFMVNGMPDTTRFDRVVGGRLARLTAAAKSADHRIVAFGEMVAWLWGRGQREAAIRLEQLWNRLAAAHSFQLLCAYPARYFFRQSDRELFMKICAEHTHVYPAERPARVAGETRAHPFLLRQQSVRSQMTAVGLRPPMDPEAEFNALFEDAAAERRSDSAFAQRLAGPVKTAMNALEHAREQLDLQEETRQWLSAASRALQQATRIVREAIEEKPETIA
ncbi:MAG TPA: MEDS domain-containing protein [Silvibacterium sp.]|nr:MEDS domain-containing protein [Silvibacterium sp.]